MTQKYSITILHKWYQAFFTLKVKENRFFLLDAIASPSTYPSQSVGQWVSEFSDIRDSYRIYRAWELVFSIFFPLSGNFTISSKFCNSLKMVKCFPLSRNKIDPWINSEEEYNTCQNMLWNIIIFLT